jgi:ABC-2 type transport system permease protein
MMKLLKIEYLKVKNYGTFWAILIIYAAFVPLTYLAIGQLGVSLLPQKSALLSFPTIWHYFTWTASWWNVLLGVLVVILVCNEFTFKTQRQNVIDGLSKRDVILGKLIFIIVLAFVIALYSFIVAAITGVIYSGTENFARNIEYVPIYFLQTIGYFAFAFMLAVLVKKPALSIILFILIIAIDVFLYNGNLLDHNAQFFPTIAISELTPNPFYDLLLGMQKADALKSGISFEEPPNMSQGTRSIVAIVYIALLFLVSFFVVKRRDL